MRKWLGLVLLASVVSIAPAADEYAEVTYNVLKVAPENYKNKNIVCSAPFLEVITTMQVLMDKENLSPKKYLWLEIGDHSVPVIVKKSDAITEITAALQRGQIVKVYGKVKQFDAKPYLSRLSHYYVLADNIEVTDEFDRSADRRPVLPQKPRRWQR
jgi:hypothetical protein